MSLFCDESENIVVGERQRNAPIILQTENIAKYMWIGRSDRTWYAEVEEVIVSIFGRDQLEYFAKILAATSIHSTLKSNLSQARRAKIQLESGAEIQGYLPNVRKQLELIRAGKELSGRKISNFAKAMAGDKYAVVVDIWVLRAFGQDRKYTRKKSGIALSGGATEKQYDAIEKWIQENAREMGLQPREFCSMIWGGVRTVATGRGNTTRYQELLKAMYGNQNKLNL